MILPHPPTTIAAPKPPRRRRASDPARLLCEECGYPLEELDSEFPCPECGQPIVQSLPHRRRGSLWQRDPTPLSLIRTNWHVLWRPRRFWRDVRLDQPRAGLLLCINILIAWLIPTLALLVTMFGPFRNMNVPYLIFFFVCGTLFIACLTAIEFAGLPFFAARRGWRVPPDASFVIVAHASAAWIISGAGVALLWVTWTLIDFYAPVILSRRVGSMGTLKDMIFPACIAVFILGMVIFSLLAGSGWKSLRYANRASPGIRE